MRWERTTPAVFAALASLSSANAVPHVARAEILGDGIRLMKCENLFHVEPSIGGIEDGLIGYWNDMSKAGPPDRRLSTKLGDRIEDFFYNGKSPDGNYGGKFENEAVMETAVQLNKPILTTPPDTAVWVGIARVRKADDKLFGYNCFTDDFHTPYTFDDPKYGTCTTYVLCIQKPALLFDALASKQAVGAPLEALPLPADIYKHFGERYDEASGVCDVEVLKLEKSGDTGEECTVKFECTNDDKTTGSVVMSTLISSLANFGATSQYSESEVSQVGQGLNCDTGGFCTELPDAMYRFMPAYTKVKATSQPTPDNGPGYGVSWISTTIECKKKEENDAFCKVLGGLFAVSAIMPTLAPAGAVAGAIVTAVYG
ncbi:hypothetical protein P154DRAFT_532598 [Amniculicola lignicola CBS 123094]|uniref:Uncharacterized protein n=1 Tax=Amniculicola lignicola CBS 123094 TaxID=1392246 RepID=A0A6A5WQC6_9PLEO|nr:hypothetical protein P154DRAFT_532598 [Amniculicola lignicola CBS 123094]